MDRRSWIGRTVGAVGAALPLGGVSWHRSTVRGAEDRQPAEAFRVELAPRGAADLSGGATMAFVAVTADDRCPADLDCDAPGSAGATIAVTRADDRGNRRTRDLNLTFHPRRPVLAYDDDQVAVVASLSGDSGIDREDLILTLVVVRSDDLGLGERAQR